MSRARRFFDWLIRLRGSPRSIAGGVAVGMVVAFTPTIGLQTLLALGLATLLGANRPVSIVPTWITNPVTIPPVYGFTYYLGSFFWPGPELERVRDVMRVVARDIGELDFLALGDQLDVFLALGVDVFVPMWIGGLIVGGVAAAVSYPVTFRVVVELRKRAERRRSRKGRERRTRRRRR